MLLRGIVRHVNQIRFCIAHILDDCLSKWQLPPGLQLMPSAASPRSGDCLDIYGTDRSTTSSFDPSSIFSDFLWFAAPKSKISPSRKRMKHLRFHPQRVEWIQCDRCGEPKRPHRMCTKNAEICIMRPEDYESYKRNADN